MFFLLTISGRDYRQWRIQDFPKVGAPTPEKTIILHFFAENCMEIKEFGSPGGARPCPPADPPMAGALWWSEFRQPQLDLQQFNLYWPEFTNSQSEFSIY